MSPVTIERDGGVSDGVIWTCFNVEVYEAIRSANIRRNNWKVRITLQKLFHAILLH